MRCKGKRIFENHQKASPKCQNLKVVDIQRFISMCFSLFIVV